ERRSPRSGRARGRREQWPLDRGRARRIRLPERTRGARSVSASLALLAPYFRSVIASRCVASLPGGRGSRERSGAPDLSDGPALPVTAPRIAARDPTPDAGETPDVWR